MRISLVAAAALMALSTPISAQEFSAEDVLERFNAQRDAFKEVAESGGMKTRNLQLMTVDDLEVDAQDDVQTLAAPATGGELQPLVAPSSNDTQVAGGTSPLQAPAPDNRADVTVASAEPTVVGVLAPELQVNLFINFAFDSAAIRADQKPTLDQMCLVMRDSDIEVFQIVGHTDTSGSDIYNERLSRLRAEEVSRYLQSSCGIDAARLKTLGLGERFPINSDDPRADENRRVEFQALS